MGCAASNLEGSIFEYNDFLHPENYAKSDKRLLKLMNLDELKDTQNPAGGVALHVAAQYSKSETVVKAMIEMYPDALTIQNNEGKTPGEIAEELNPDIAELFK